MAAMPLNVAGGQSQVEAHWTESDKQKAFTLVVDGDHGALQDLLAKKEKSSTALEMVNDRGQTLLYATLRASGWKFSEQRPEIVKELLDKWSVNGDELSFTGSFNSPAVHALAMSAIDWLHKDRQDSNRHRALQQIQSMFELLHERHVDVHAVDHEQKTAMALLSRAAVFPGDVHATTFMKFCSSLLEPPLVLRFADTDEAVAKHLAGDFLAQIMGLNKEGLVFDDRAGMLWTYDWETFSVGAPDAGRRPVRVLGCSWPVVDVQWEICAKDSAGRFSEWAPLCDAGLLAQLAARQVQGTDYSLDLATLELTALQHGGAPGVIALHGQRLRWKPTLAEEEDGEAEDAVMAVKLEGGAGGPYDDDDDDDDDGDEEEGGGQGVNAGAEEEEEEEPLPLPLPPPPPPVAMAEESQDDASSWGGAGGGGGEPEARVREEVCVRTTEVQGFMYVLVEGLVKRLGLAAEHWGMRGPGLLTLEVTRAEREVVKETKRRLYMLTQTLNGMHELTHVLIAGPRDAMFDGLRARRMQHQTTQDAQVRGVVLELLRYLSGQWDGLQSRRFEALKRVQEASMLEFIRSVLNADSPEQYTFALHGWADTTLERVETEAPLDHALEQGLRGFCRGMLPPEADLDPLVWTALQAFVETLLESATHSARAGAEGLDLYRFCRTLLIHVQSARRNLPFYGRGALEAVRLLQDSAGPDVLVVPTPTGSGKSTLLPLLVSAMPRYQGQRIAVTQPRRFAAESVYNMISATYGESMVGFAMAGKARNPTAPILYITDGLLRTLINPFHDKAVRRFRFGVVVVDEVHERSKDIDACVALLARLQLRQRQLHLPVTKVILASATFDTAVLRPFQTHSPPPHILQLQFDAKHRVTRHCFDVCTRVGPGACPLCNLFRSRRHVVDVVTAVHNLLKDGEQALCFLPSAALVDQVVEVLSRRNVGAVALKASQDGVWQQHALQRERLFIATNIAETSLTFPRLAYVVDAGLVQRPVSTEQGLLMETVDAPVSTLEQRAGRLGRVRDGEYIGLYERRNGRNEHIEAKTGLGSLQDLVFELQLQLRVPQMQPLTMPEFRDADRQPCHVVEIPPLHSSLKRVPQLGGRAMTMALLAAKDTCAKEVAALAAMRMNLMPKHLTRIGKACASAAHGWGDVLCAVDVMLLLMKRSRARLESDEKRYRANNNHQPPSPVVQRQLFHAAARLVIQRECPGLSSMAGLLLRTLDRLRRTEQQLEPQWGPLCTAAPSDRAEAMCRALTSGFQNHVWAHCRDLDGPKGYYARMSDVGDGGGGARTIARVHGQSKVAAAPKVVLALDLMMFGVGVDGNAGKVQIATLQSVEPVEACWIDTSITTTRKVLLDQSEVSKVHHPWSRELRGGDTYAVLKGSVAFVYREEVKLRRELQATSAVPLIGQAEHHLLTGPSADHVKGLLKAQQASKKQAWNPLKWFWANTANVTLEYQFGPPDVKDMCVKVTGRERFIGEIKEHLRFWFWQLKSAALVVHFDANEYALYTRPKALEKDDGFRHRLRAVTDPDLTEAERADMVVGPRASRETRMELVANVAINVLGCRLGGGFIRDWVVRGVRRYAVPYTCRQDWVEDKTNPPDPRFPNCEWFPIKEGVEPKDLDFELPVGEAFDPFRFISELTRLGIDVDYHQYTAQRHVFLLECARGPFSADFVEPHFAQLHTKVDMDVNMLTCQRPFVLQLGLKLPIPRDKATVETVLRNIQSQRFHKFRQDGNIADRVKKMVDRGWKHDPVGDLDFSLGQGDLIGNQSPSVSSVVLVSNSDPVLQEYKELFAKVRFRGQVLQAQGLPPKIVRMYRITNPDLEKAFDAEKERIQADCRKHHVPFTPNELKLHGCASGSVQSIINDGFDDHYFNNSGWFGRGCYFSDKEVQPDGSVSGLSWSFSTDSIFVCEVIVGHPHADSTEANPRQNPCDSGFWPPLGRHSVRGNVNIGSRVRERETVVYRLRQAIPRFLIKYEF